MPPEIVHGIVLRFANYRESDRILTLFTAEQGRISAAARGCRKPASKLRAACDYLIFGEYALRPAGGSLTVTSAAVLDSFYDLRTNFEALGCAFYLRDFCDAVIGDSQPNPELFTLFVRSLGALCHRKAAAATVRAAFEIRAMDGLGLGPALSHCAVCGAETASPAYFSVRGGGAVCDRCREGGESCERILPGSVETLRKLRKADAGELHVYAPVQAVASDLEGFWRSYIGWHLDRRFNAGDFAKKLESFARERQPGT